MVPRGDIVSRILIVTNGNYFARIILEPLLLRKRAEIAGVVLVTGDYKGRVGLRALWGVGRRTALPYTAYKVVQYLLFRAARVFAREGWFEVTDMVRLLGLRSISCVRVNDPEVIEWVRGLEPDLLVSVSCPQRIRKTFLSLPRVGSINVHSSLLPRYAGLAPYYWVLANGEQVTGVSVHYMTEQFDEGRLLVQMTLTVRPGMSAFDLFLSLARLGSHALLEAVDMALAGHAGMEQDLSMRSYFSNPTWESYLALRRKGFAIARLSEMLRTIREEVKYAEGVSKLLASGYR